MDESNFVKYQILGNDPVLISDLLGSFDALQRIYRSSLYQNRELLGNFDERLYIKSVREGSQVYELVALTLAGALPLVSDANALTTFFKNTKNLTNYFLRKNQAPKKIKPKDCSNIAKLVGPGANSSEGLNISVNNGDVNIEQLVLNINPNESQRIIQNALTEKARLEAPQIELEQNKVLNFIQANAIQTATHGVTSPDKGIIRDLSDKPHSIVFAENLMNTKKSLLRDNNFYTSSFLVDVEVARSDGKIKAYIVNKIQLI